MAVPFSKTPPWPPSCGVARSPFVPRRREGWSACGLHERFRFYRYEAAEQFGAHYDGAVRRGEFEESKLTFMIYLSDVAEGGSTNFIGPGLAPQFEVRPTRGKALIFEHVRLHEGAPVLSGASTCSVPMCCTPPQRRMPLKKLSPTKLRKACEKSVSVHIFGKSVREGDRRWWVDGPSPTG